MQLRRKFVLRLRALTLLGALAACSGAQEAEPDEPRVRTPPGKASGARPVEPARTPAAEGSAQVLDSESETGELFIPRPALDRVLDGGAGRLLAQVPLEPVIEPGRKLVGFRVAELFGNTPRVLRFGVRPRSPTYAGDVLVAVAGVRMVTPGDLMTILQKLRGADTLEVVLLRDGKRLDLAWPIRPSARPRPVPPPPDTSPTMP